MWGDDDPRITLGSQEQEGDQLCLVVMEQARWEWAR